MFRRLVQKALFKVVQLYMYPSTDHRKCQYSSICVLLLLGFTFKRFCCIQQNGNYTNHDLIKCIIVVIIMIIAGYFFYHDNLVFLGWNMYLMHMVVGGR